MTDRTRALSVIKTIRSSFNINASLSEMIELGDHVREEYGEFYYKGRVIEVIVSNCGIGFRDNSTSKLCRMMFDNTRDPFMIYSFSQHQHPYYINFKIDNEDKTMNVMERNVTKMNEVRRVLMLREGVAIIFKSLFIAMTQYTIHIVLINEDRAFYYSRYQSNSDYCVKVISIVHNILRDDIIDELCNRWLETNCSDYIVEDLRSQCQDILDRIEVRSELCEDWIYNYEDVTSTNNEATDEEAMSDAMSKISISPNRIICNNNVIDHIDVTSNETIEDDIMWCYNHNVIMIPSSIINGEFIDDNTTSFNEYQYLIINELQSIDVNCRYNNTIYYDNDSLDLFNMLEDFESFSYHGKRVLSNIYCYWICSKLMHLLQLIYSDQDINYDILLHNSIDVMRFNSYSSIRSCLLGFNQVIIDIIEERITIHINHNTRQCKVDVVRIQ